MPNPPEAAAERQAVLRSILARQPVQSQQQLCTLLRKKGFEVTQSSVSRDLRELGAAKVDGRYVLRDALVSSSPAPDPMLEVGTWLRTVRCAGPHLLVVHTPPGRASAVALALDEANWKEVVGTIAGDDTVFIATAGRTDQVKLESRLSHLEEQHHG